MTVAFCGLELAHPVVNAAGTYDPVAAARTFVEPPFAFSAFVTPTVGTAPRTGEPPPRLWEAAAGLVTATGRPNAGVAGYLAGELAEHATLDVPLVVSVGAATPGELAALAATVGAQAAVAAVELDLGWPDPATRTDVGADPARVTALVRAARAATAATLVVKLSANTADPAACAQAAEATGADALALIGTVRAASPTAAGRRAGLSGPAVRVIALAHVALVAARVAVPVVGIGGVQRGRHAQALLEAGATLVAVGSESFRDPGSGGRIVAELAALG